MRKLPLILGLVTLLPTFSTFAHAGTSPGGGGNYIIDNYTIGKNCSSVTYTLSDSGKATPIHGKGCFDDPKEYDSSPIYTGAGPAERKMLNGDSEGKPGPVPDGDDNDHGSSGCKDDDCERGE